ncbi:MAG TPA: C25 family cysteine peptidase [Myxococcota bacterium]|nr:C25 family cysteine peptidase [Myxococcota bacterium]
MKRWQWMNMMVALLLLSLPARAGMVEIEVKVQKPMLWQDSQGYTHVEVPGLIKVGRPGEPELPVGSVRALVPAGQRVESVSLASAESVELSGSHTLFPKQGPWPLSWGQPPFTQPSADIYSKSAFFPARLFRTEPLQYMRGFPILPVTVHPVVYNPASGKLAYFPVLTLRIKTVPDGEGRMGDLYRGYGRDFDTLRTLVSNPDELSSYPSRKESNRLDSRYVMVTSQALSTCAGPYNLQALEADKQSRGITTLIMTMEDIRNQYSGVDDAAKVRAFITDMYQNSGTDWVLLAGDADLQDVGGETQAPIVPVRGLCCYLDGMGTDYNIPSDLYYAALDGTFNSDGDNCWGEQNDGTDLLPEVWVGRVPADSCTEISNFVRKTLTYQGSSGDWLRNVYLVGEWLWDDYPGYSFGYNFLTDVHHSSTTDGYDTKGFSESTFYQVTVMDDQFEDGPVCSGQSSPCWTPDEMLAVLNGGNHVINHLGHSDVNYNMRLYCDDIAGGLSNTLPFFDYSQGCYPAAFDNQSVYYGVTSQDSFVEYLTLGYYGAFAAVMNSRYGLGWYSNYFNRYFWDAAFRQTIAQPGEMHSYSLVQMSPFVWTDTGIQWVYYVANFFGDPEVTLQGILPMQGPYLSYVSHEITSDGTVPIPAGPGRHVMMPVTLRNMGTEDATGIVTTLSSTSPEVTITQANSVFANIVAGSNGRSTTHAEFDIAPSAADGAHLDFALAWTASGGYSGTVNFTVSVQRPQIVYLAHTLDDSAAGCDSDGIADAGELAVFTVTVQNQGSGAASNVVLSLSASDCAVSSPVSVGDIAAGATADADFTVTPSASIACPASNWPFIMTAQAAELPQPDTSGFDENVNADLEQSTFSDNMEGTPPNDWSHSASIGTDDWAYVTSSYHSATHAWFCSDPGTQSEKFLLTPSFSIGASTQLTFWHRIESEAQYDGGVLEISVNGGAYQDLGGYITQNGYNDTISEWTDSTIAGRAAWAGSADWQQVSVNLSSFGPADVVVRFRFASDGYVNATGWWIDDFAIDTQTPICQQQSCNQPPVVDAGPDQNVQSGDQAQLAGNAHDPEGLSVQLTWSQTAGASVTLSDIHALNPTFTAPQVSGSQVLAFLLSASDGVGTSTDNVNVTVWNCDDNEPCTTDDFSGSSCSHTQHAECSLCGSDGVCLNGVCQAGGQSTEVICDDADACTQKDICQDGQCAGTDPLVCQPLDQCHDAGSCNPANGACSNPEKADGAACDDADACTLSDSCQAGVCTGANTVVCIALDQCHDVGTCDASTGACSNPEKTDGSACDDQSLCTTGDTCQAGVCTGASEVQCTTPDQCHGAACDPQSGQCEYPAVSDGSACDDADACTPSDTCQAGVCTGANPVVCTALDQCHDAGSCDTSTGVCSNPEKADGAACDDADACTQTDSCQTGVCTGGNPVVCEVIDQCHDTGSCDSSTGACSNPEKADGTVCDDMSLCTSGDTCQAGMCTGGNPVTCQAQDECHLAGTCDAQTGSCSNPLAPEGTECADGTCQDGVCTPSSGGCGCSAGGNAGGSWWLMLLGALLLRRRRY